MSASKFLHWGVSTYTDADLRHEGRCRSVERRAGKVHGDYVKAAAKLDVPFVPPPTADEEGQPPTEDEMARVRGVLAEWSDLGDYLHRANAPGSRIGTYRDASPSGETLVSFLAQTAPAELWECLAAFRAAVDTLLPGRYAWMASDSLHCTVRALDLLD